MKQIFSCTLNGVGFAVVFACTVFLQGADEPNEQKAPAVSFGCVKNVKEALEGAIECGDVEQLREIFEDTEALIQSVGPKGPFENTSDGKQTLYGLFLIKREQGKFAESFDVVKDLFKIAAQKTMKAAIRSGDIAAVKELMQYFTDGTVGTEGPDSKTATGRTFREILQKALEKTEPKQSKKLEEIDAEFDRIASEINLEK